MKRVSIVGNGNISDAQLLEISDSDVIIRFNSPPDNHLDVSSRTDQLYLAISAKLIGELLKSGEFRNNRAFISASSIFLPVHSDIIIKYFPKPNILSRLKGRRADWTDLCLQFCRRNNKTVSLLSGQSYLDACNLLEIFGKNKGKYYPSSGFLAIQNVLKEFPQHSYEIHVYGFGFKGWKRHKWNAEKTIVQRLAQQNRINLHPYNTPPEE